MNKNDLVNQVSDSTGLSKSDSAKAVDSVFESITSTLKSGGDVRLVGFGTFLVSKRKATTGRNPQTGESVDEWGCAVTWLPILLIENSQKQRETGAAVETFRNETLNRLSQTITMRKIENPIDKLEGVSDV